MQQNNPNLLVKTINSQQKLLREVRSVCSRIIAAADFVFLDANKAVTRQKRVSLMPNQTLNETRICSSEAKIIADYFFKATNLLVKIIPLECQVAGTKIVKERELASLRQEQQNFTEVSPSEIAMMEDFLARHYQKSNQTSPSGS